MEGGHTIQQKETRRKTSWETKETRPREESPKEDQEAQRGLGDYGRVGWPHSEFLSTE